MGIFKRYKQRTVDEIKRRRAMIGKTISERRKYNMELKKSILEIRRKAYKEAALKHAEARAKVIAKYRYNPFGTVTKQKPVRIKRKIIKRKRKQPKSKVVYRYIER